MMFFKQHGNWCVVAVAMLVLGAPGVRGAFYMSVVAETFSPDVAAFTPASGKPVTYAALDGGYIDSGDPVGGMAPPAAPMISASMTKALADRGFQRAAPGATPSLLIVYHWGEIRHDSFQVRPTDHLKGNDRARLRLVARTADADRIERDIVNDEFSSLKVGAMTRTAPDRETLQVAHDELSFVVVSAYDTAALRDHHPTLAWQVRLTTRAVGQSMSDALVSLIHYGAPYFGRNEVARQDLKEAVIPATGIAPASPGPALNEVPAGLDAGFVHGIVQSEHAMWSGTFPRD